MVDKEYCMSAFLTFRYIPDPEKQFAEGIKHRIFKEVPDTKKTACESVEDIELVIKNELDKIDLKKSALLLSGGIDSGILASYLPEGTAAYTTLSPAKNSQIEINRAARVCEKYNLDHRLISVSWEDYDKYIDMLMEHDGYPLFANEPQVFSLAKKIKDDGFDTIIYGDNADMAFGGMSLMLSKDWTFNEWVERYTFVDPYSVLVHPVSMREVYEQYRQGDGVQLIRFINDIFSPSSSGAYVNAFDCLGIKYLDPYAVMKMARPLDLERVRSGDSKYMLRELYRRRFQGFEVPEKIAMERAVDKWMADWKGPERKEFKDSCIEGMTGEQKFMIYSLERFLNNIDEKK